MAQDLSLKTVQPGQRVAITEQIAHRTRPWTTKVEGTVVKADRRKTGSWFAHSKDDKLWLDRIELRKDDGELVICNLDQYTHVEILPSPEAEEASDVDADVDADVAANDASDAATAEADSAE